jgi:outer membrane protein insertion porin family
MKFRVFAFLLFTTAVLGFSQETSQQGDDWYQGKPIRDILFNGLKNVRQSELDALMQHYKGIGFNDTVFWEIQGKLYALEYFDHIEPSTRRANAEGSEVTIVFTVVERPLISRINFVGLAGLRRSDLMDVISSKVNEIYNQAKVRIDIEAIINKYVEKGYPNVTVTASEVKSGDSSVTLVFNITERERISISKIEFQGNSTYRANTLRRQLSLKTKTLINSGAFQEAKLLADREAVTRYYHEHGYIDAVVRDVTRTYESDSKGVNMVLTFMIEEGNQFKFAGVTFEGNVIFSSEQLQKLISSKIGGTVNMTQVEMDLQRVADLYFENGYINNSITRMPHKDYQTSELSYTVSIVERSRAYVENIIIIGNDKTKDYVILREIPMEPGDIFSKTKLMEAWRNLMNLQYFTLVIPEPTQGSAENLMDLVFTVEEQLTTELQFGLTFSGSADPETFPISGVFKINDRNLRGTGNELGVEFNSSIVDTTSFAVNYLHRHVLGLPLSLGVDLSANFSKRLTTMDSMWPFFNGDETDAYPDGFDNYDEYIAYNKTPTRDYLMDYEQWYLSMGLSSGYRWSTFLGIFGVNGGLRIGTIRNSYDSDIYRPFDPALRAGNNSWTPKNSFWFSLSLDQRDIFYDPSRGFYVYERMGFYGIFDQEKEHYIRNDAKAQYFLTLFDFRVTDNWNFKSVFGINAGLSLLIKQGDHRPLVIEEANKLAVDGMFVGRGWSSEYRNKGLLLLDTWAELRFPVVKGILSFDFFFDAAGVESSEGYYFGENETGGSNFTVENLRFSYGGGLRFTMPQFPIRLSLAKRFIITDGKVELQPGALFGDPSNPALGMDLVVSFVISY